MAFQSGAFQGDAFQTTVPEPPVPSAPPIGGIIEFPVIRRVGVALVQFRITGRARLEWFLSEDDVRRRVREFLSSLIG